MLKIVTQCHFTIHYFVAKQKKTAIYKWEKNYECVTRNNTTIFFEGIERKLIQIVRLFYIKLFCWFASIKKYKNVYAYVVAVTLYR